MDFWEESLNFQQDGSLQGPLANLLPWETHEGANQGGPPAEGRCLSFHLSPLSSCAQKQIHSLALYCTRVRQ